MSKVLYFLREFEGRDIDWFVSVGHRVTLPKGTELIRANEEIDAIYILVEGELHVAIGAAADPIARLSVGELVGELSFLDSRPPNATVIAACDCAVMSLPRLLMEAKLKKDAPFAARFYRAIGVLLANRLRQTVINLGFPQGQDGAPATAPDPDLALAEDWFKFLMRKLKAS